MKNSKLGKVYLVGAGLGNVDYLTVRSHQLLTQAEVIIYDALVDDSILQLIPSNCLKLDVGKRGGKPSTPQSEINQLLVEYCQQGKQVVRLKGGDPFIFGRTSREIQALIAANCVFEVVPGISSVLAAPLLAGIPLTDAVMSRCFAVLTAHEPEAIDWNSVSQIDTLVILMGSRNLTEIIHQLQRHGRSPQTPIAIIREGGRPQQQVWIGTLSDIIEKTANSSLSPCVIVVGEVVNLRDFLQSPVYPMSKPQNPLSEKTILVTRAAGQSSKFSELLTAEGATVIEMPALVIGPPSSWMALDQAIAHFDATSPYFNWLILTSANGVNFFFDRLQAKGKDPHALSQTKIAVVGKKTAASLQKYELQPDFIPPDFVADSLVSHFPESLAGKRILFPRVETGGRDVLVQELTQQGAEVVEVPAYESRCPDTIAPDVLEALQQHKIDVITFASSKTVQNFSRLTQFLGKDLWSDVCIASIGPQTSETCQQLLGRLDIEAKEYTLEGLTEVIVDWELEQKKNQGHL
ncbi:uroporphyrinogen-III C-methyltransferase [Lyngbya aestuarii BL J]|uniref:uroporphyrinogen-III C-methyltransferase n=1 Tax=Lyngbya aestuarii BL J TaxID=1348334 RepID=U7QJ90_9CYAN|nr:uroporphyrinogen-III C-methyltransferase [Lyngbya aestuarii]ERT08024.1 uroporphyrinogen-III C-methyltransferase [Lyngbya aestuarii BL J]